MKSFTYAGSPARILFGSGRSAEVSSAVEALGCRRALVLATPHQKADAEALSERLGALSVGVFSGAVMHTPVDVTEKALKVVREQKPTASFRSAAAPPRGSARRLPTAPICRRSSSPRPMPAPKSPRSSGRPKAVERPRSGTPASCRKSSSTIRT